MGDPRKLKSKNQLEQHIIDNTKVQFPYIYFNYFWLNYSIHCFCGATLTLTPIIFNVKTTFILPYKGMYIFVQFNVHYNKFLLIQISVKYCNSISSL